MVFETAHYANLSSITNSSFIASTFLKHSREQTKLLCQTFINHSVSVIIFITDLTTREQRVKWKSNMSVERTENYFFYHHRTKRNFMFRVIKIFHKNCFSVGNFVGGRNWSPLVGNRLLKWVIIYRIYHLTNLNYIRDNFYRKVRKSLSWLSSFSKTFSRFSCKY